MSHTTLHCAEADLPFSSAPPGHGQSWEVLVMRQQGWEESSGEGGPPGAVFITALNHKGPRGVGKPQTSNPNPAIPRYSQHSAKHCCHQICNWWARTQHVQMFAGLGRAASRVGG